MKGTNMKKLKLMVATLGLALGAGAVPNFPSGTFVVLGNAKNWKNASYNSTDEVTVSAVATNGTILAEATVNDPSGGRNFALQIPLSTQPSAKTARVGDPFRLWTFYGKQDGAASDVLTVGCANSRTNVSLVIQATQAFVTTNSAWATDASGKTVSVAQAYLDELEPWLEAYGIPAYDADADWDQDGQPNYQEYLAGTHPLEPTDYLSVSSIDFVNITDFKTNLSSNASASRVAITFECVNGHTYVIPSSTSLNGKNWSNKPVATKPEDAPSASAYTADGTEDGDTVTLYMLPAVEAKQEFFTVQPK